jgi:hypothetical protein
MTTHRDLMTEKHKARLAKLPANSGHAKVLRAKLGLGTPAPAPKPVSEPVPVKKVKKKKSKKK